VFKAKKEAVMTASTRSEFGSVSEPTLYVAFELSAKQWKLATTSGWGIAPWVRTVPSGELSGVTRAVSQARARFGRPPSAAVVSCYEAGRDGFWIHRALQSLGVVNRVVDSASIEVNRRARRAKTDRLDALKLVTMLVRVCRGERGVWREVRVPSIVEEAARQVSRERPALTQEQTRLTNQMRGWLATWGCRLPARRVDGWWTTVRDWADAPLPGTIQARLGRAPTRWVALAAQIAALDDQQCGAMTAAASDSALGRLVRITGVATTSASVLLDEGLVWRAFRTRREIGGILGFAPTPYQSGDRYHEQGIGRAGNHRLQAMSVQLAWQWVRWQPDSPMTHWFQARYAAGSGRLRRIGIVAVARRLVIALWRDATTGVIPAGAILKGT
jgi:transposase